MDKDARTTAELVFANYLGLDIDTEQDLIYIAKEALDNLPSGWELGIGEGANAGIPFFYNETTGVLSLRELSSFSIIIRTKRVVSSRRKEICENDKSGETS